MTKLAKILRLDSLVLLLYLLLTGAAACADQESPLQSVFDAFMKCDTVTCAAVYLDGVILKQLESLSPEKATKVLRHLKLSSYRAKSKTLGKYGALFISDYKGPETQGGITMVYLFEKMNNSWKIYHRLPQDDVGPNLRPISK